MKVLLFNGSPNENGCTFTALSEIEKVRDEEKIDDISRFFFFDIFTFFIFVFICSKRKR